MSQTMSHNLDQEKSKNVEHLAQIETKNSEILKLEKNLKSQNNKITEMAKIEKKLKNEIEQEKEKYFQLEKNREKNDSDLISSLTEAEEKIRNFTNVETNYQETKKELDSTNVELEKIKNLNQGLENANHKMIKEIEKNEKKIEKLEIDKSKLGSELENLTQIATSFVELEENSKSIETQNQQTINKIEKENKNLKFELEGNNKIIEQNKNDFINLKQNSAQGTLYVIHTCK